MSSIWLNPIPYCGAPALPGTLLARWNLDPILITVLLGALGLYLAGALRQPAEASPRFRLTVGSFVAGWLIGSLALISPLCPLSVALFSARVGQHMVLTLIAAPLIMLGRPGAALARLWPKTAKQVGDIGGLKIARGPIVSTAIFAAFLWFWHSPGPYDLTFASPLAYWLMHITVVGGALMVWNVVLRPSANIAPAVAVATVTGLQMTFLGALITLTTHMLYAPHAVLPLLWGLDQARDQQIGGLIMWVPGCTVFLGVSLVTLAGAMSERPAKSQLRAA